MARRKPYEHNLEHKALPLERFSWDPATGHLTAFESDLRSQPFNGRYPWLTELYNDACDIGMAIRSHHTDRIETFVLYKEDTREGDLLAWHFHPTNLQCAVREVTIFND